MTVSAGAIKICRPGGVEVATETDERKTRKRAGREERHRAKRQDDG